MVLATQDPTIKNMKVDIGNITTRMAFACAKYHNSITILGEGGAEKLPGKGAMLYKSNEHPEPIYIQGAYVSPDEIKRIVANVLSASHDMSNKLVIQGIDMVNQPIWAIGDTDTKSSLSVINKELTDIIMWTLSRDNVSKLQIMQQFHMGNRADNIINELYQMNIITDKNANQPRIVIPQSISDIPSEVVDLLSVNGVSEEDVASIINRRI
jgi:S-DNA-T family DNA segregation ATPase FtsK/SpoIIIE